MGNSFPSQLYCVRTHLPHVPSSAWPPVVRAGCHGTDKHTQECCLLVGLHESTGLHDHCKVYALHSIFNPMEVLN